MGTVRDGTPSGTYLLFGSLFLADIDGADKLSQAEGHIVCGDAIQVLRSFPSGSVDLVHTSPPYNIDKRYASSPTDKAPVETYGTFLKTAISEIRRVTRPGGSIFWQTGYTQSEDTPGEIVPIDVVSYEMFRSGPEPCLLWDRIIWRYWGGHAFTKKFTNKHETVLWFVKPGADPLFDVDAVRERPKEYDKRNNFWGRNPGNVWEVDRVAFGSTEQTSHIAVFPEQVTERIVRACSQPGDLVLDPFAGSGTVPKVARGLSRRWIGIEISPIYAQEAAVRVGFQQPDEVGSLTSELIKRLVFHNHQGSAEAARIADTLRTWIRAVPMESAAMHFEADVRAVFEDGSGRNQTKRDVWMKYDALLRNSKAEGHIQAADALLSACYKLRSELSGVTRFKSALDVLNGVTSRVGDSDEAVAYVKLVASQEPSSYQLDGDSVTLIPQTRRILQVQQDAYDPASALSDDENCADLQGRLHLE